ncbi:H-NS family nucleoid-associated regulatory protein [Luteimonas terrae]|uniref:H-NS histone family protein n=1 Tax=Luteimonas terrae TaxID=1530191 RepID=A0A4R5U8R1_9GAMM|nr:H-NS histone family protein [Luteimonas terrae]KPN17253.1 DNA-binding protein [Xanthomonas sp. Mitacek01]TDK30688.1 H-NS histone family protein [Luteimonas terrae]
MKIDVDALTSRELDALIAAAEKRRALLARRRPIAVVRAELIAFAADCGYRIEELVGTQATQAAPRKAARRKSGKVAAKYRDPHNRRNTWSGRGRMPLWLVSKTRQGLSAADFLIPGLAKPTANTRAIGQKTVFKGG